MIVVFGSINIDLAFTVERRPAAGETVLCPAYQMSPGGKGANQALAASRAGTRVAMSAPMPSTSSTRYAAALIPYVRSSARSRRPRSDLGRAMPSPNRFMRPDTYVADRFLRLGISRGSLRM